MREICRELGEIKLREVARWYEKIREVTKSNMSVFNTKAAYENLKFYQDICELRHLVYKYTVPFSRTHLKLVSQMRDAARSAKQNVREGYRRGSLPEFLRFLKISQGSLAELIGDIEDCREDRLITDEQFQALSELARSGAFLMSRYVQSLYKIEQEGTWKVPGKASDRIRESSAIYAASRNLS